MATPYLNLEISELQLGHVNYYDNLNTIYGNFYGDFPDVIIDSKGWMPEVFEKIPILEREYINMKEGYYVRKSQ